MDRINLYTEEQVRMLDINYGNSTLDEVIECLTPIYIPNDNQLKEISKHEILYNDTKRAWWLEGANYILHILKLQLDDKDD